MAAAFGAVLVLAGCSSEEGRSTPAAPPLRVRVDELSARTTTQLAEVRLGPSSIATDGPLVLALGRSDPTGAGSTRLLRSEDGGRHWSAVTLDGRLGQYGFGVAVRGAHALVWGVAEGTVATPTAGVLTSDDGGRTWSHATLPGAGAVASTARWWRGGWIIAGATDRLDLRRGRPAIWRAADGHHFTATSLPGVVAGWAVQEVGIAGDDLEATATGPTATLITWRSRDGRTWRTEPPGRHLLPHALTWRLHHPGRPGTIEVATTRHGWRRLVIAGKELEPIGGSQVAGRWFVVGRTTPNQEAAVVHLAAAAGSGFTDTGFRLPCPSDDPQQQDGTADPPERFAGRLAVIGSCSVAEEGGGLDGITSLSTSTDGGRTWRAARLPKTAVTGRLLAVVRDGPVRRFVVVHDADRPQGPSGASVVTIAAE